MTEKIKKFIKKGNYTKTKIVLLILISIIGAFILTSIARRGFIWDRIPILTVILFFAGSHFIFNIKELYNNIYKYKKIRQPRKPAKKNADNTKYAGKSRPYYSLKE